MNEHGLTALMLRLIECLGDNLAIRDYQPIGTPKVPKQKSPESKQAQSHSDVLRHSLVPSVRFELTLDGF